MKNDHFITDRAKSITPFLVMDVLEKAGQMEDNGEDIVHFELGEPAFDTPLCIREAAKNAIDKGLTAYAPSLGLPELREAIASRYKDKYGIDISPERVVVTSGSSPALQMIFAALVDKGGDSLSFTYDLLEKAKVALTPGVDFGEAGEGFIRIISIERIDEGLKRLKNYLEGIQS